MYPRLREDLIITELKEGGQGYFIVKDPITQRFFRFREPEYFIASQLDGNTSLEIIRNRFQQKFDVTLPVERLETFIKRLGDLCLVEGGLTEREISRLQRQSSSEQGWLRRIFFLKLKAVDPNRFFDSIIGDIGFFFTKPFVTLAVLVTLVAVVITISNWGQYTAQVSRLFRPDIIPTFLLVVFIVTGLHEFAHGLTCKHYGGEVHDMGFLLIYFLPAFYCNVSDAWLFSDKRKRLWVSFAGMFFQIFIWALATIIWRVIDPETWLSDACAIAMATSGLTALFNLNPLIKLDGYYLLSDYLGIPNLRRKAFDYLGSQVKQGLTLVEEREKEISRRQKKIYVSYGISAGVYSFGLLLFVFIKVAGFVFSKFRGSGLIVLTVIIVLAFAVSFDRLAVRIRGLLKEGEGVNRRRKRLVVTLMVIAAALLVLFFGRWELKISNDCRLLASSEACVRAELNGIIRDIYVDSGDTVVAGQLIAQLDDSELRADVSKTEAEIAKRQAELELLRKGPLKEEISRIKKVVEKARTKVAFAEKEFQRIQELYSKNLISSLEYEQAQENLNVLRKELEHAESDLDVLLTGNRPETIRAAEAEIARLEASQDYLIHQIEQTSVKTPISGIVSTQHLKDRCTEYLEIGDEICKIVNPTVMLVEIPVSEKDVADIRDRQRVKLKARSLPGQSFYGTVTAIAPAAVNNDRRTVVIVTSKVNNQDLSLKPGMTGHAKIYCGKRSIINLWTRRMVRFIRVEFWL